MQESSSNNKQKSSIVLKIVIPFVVVALGVFIYFNINDLPNKSKVEGMSDDVYEQLVEHYFFAISLKEASKEEQPNFSWIEEHAKYEDAMAYFEASKEPITPLDAFPNPLFIEYDKNQSAYNEVESAYIKRVKDLSSYFVREDEDIFEKYQTELKEEMHIKESYNPFD